MSVTDLSVGNSQNLSTRPHSGQAVEGHEDPSDRKLVAAQEQRLRKCVFPLSSLPLSCENEKRDICLTTSNNFCSFKKLT